MALTYIGGELAGLSLGLPAAAIQLFQGMLLFFLLAVDLLTNYRVRFGIGEAYVGSSHTEEELGSLFLGS